MTFVGAGLASAYRSWFSTRTGARGAPTCTVVRPSRFDRGASEVLQLREKLMKGAPQPTRIAGPRPRHGGTIDRVLDGTFGSLYYRVTAVA